MAKTKTQYLRVPVQVTAKDIATGDVYSKNYCMVCIALDRVIRPKVYFRVTDCGELQWELYNRNGNGEGCVALPKSVQTKLEAWQFDKDRKCKPFAFNLRLPVYLLRPSIVQKLTSTNPNAKP